MSSRTGMYDDTRIPSPGPPDFAAAEIHDPAAEQEHLQEQVQQLIWCAEEIDEFSNDDHMATADDLEFEEDDEEDNDNTESGDPCYSPYLNKVVNQFKMILWILKECKVSNVPSYYAFRKMQNELCQLCGSQPKAYTSMVGNRFFMNNIRDSVARDFANPEVAKHLSFYLEETKGPISEVIPRAWIKQNGVICADCVDALPSMTGWGIGTEVRSVLATRFSYNYYNYNKHINMYMANSNLPGQHLQQEYFVRFVSTSPHATSPEQFSAIKEQIQADPIQSYNAEIHQNCHYWNGLIGKHFKTLMQTMVFHMHGLVSPELFRLVKAVCALGSVFWVHEINDIKQYTADLTIFIGNVLDAFGDCEPS
ncbi:hypothetical protein B0H10DRAFT_1942597 [Mycena sp. CBHHK59/15]|nr:hypothetical protein B0H10DRAFT_1942597 [Mycena sp. CBHHK59/15]